MPEPKAWKNWSGSLTFTPACIREPNTEEELAQIVKKAAEDNRKVRVAGAGHSSSPLLETKDLLVSLKNFKGVYTHQEAQQQATLGTGMTVKEVNNSLLAIGLAVHNTGDVDVQTLAGAIGTGTHGTGIRLQNLSSMLIGGRMVTGRGEIKEFSIEKDPGLLQALRVSMGTCGIFTAMKLQLQPAFRLHRSEWCCPVGTALEHLEELIAENRNFDFYWYPRRDEVKLRILNQPDKRTTPLPYARCVEEQEGWVGEVLPKTRLLKFDEMEYFMPLEAGAACFREIRRVVKEKHRTSVGWRVLYRTVKADEAYLSPAHQQDSAIVSLHQNATLPFWQYFKDIEPIFRDHGGRPHWGKKFTLKAKELKPLYPKWQAFHAVRKALDPQGVFMSPYMHHLFEGA